MGSHRSVAVATTRNDAHDTSSRAASVRAIVEARKHDIRRVEHVGDPVAVVVGEVGDGGRHHDLAHAGDFNFLCGSAYLRLRRRPAASDGRLELAYRRSELACLDGVAGDAHSKARLTELVGFTVLAERAFVKERDTVATDARLAARAAECLVASAQL